MSLASDTICLIFFFFNDTATTEIYTLSLHDALPICAGDVRSHDAGWRHAARDQQARDHPGRPRCMVRLRDRKSTRLNSSHLVISYAVFCLKKKKKKQTQITPCPTLYHILRIL